MKIDTKDQRAMAAEVAFRQRALGANRRIYARRHGPSLMSLLAGAGGLRARYIGQLASLEAETVWGADHARRLAELADEIDRYGCLRPEIAETCAWHADRLRELVRQHAVLAQLEKAHRLHAAWPGFRNGAAVGACPRTLKRAKARRLRA
jgi:hypothetical protein